jgi:hypothetical protein
MSRRARIAVLIVGGALGTMAALSWAQEAPENPCQQTCSQQEQDCEQRCSVGENPVECSSACHDAASQCRVRCRQ